MLPVIAGVSYEILRLGANSKWLSFFLYPGLLIQSLTTLEPTDDMIEVSIKSLKAVLD